MSVYEDILNAVQSTVEGLELEGVEAVLIRKLPRNDEELDELPIIVIAPEDPEEVRHDSFESVNVIYTVEIVWIGAGGVQTLDQVEEVLTSRETVRRAFQGPELPGVEEVWKTDMAPGSAFHRRGLNENYDYSGLRVRFHAHEPREN
ncbi:MAG: hypothetical protein AB7K24_05730 [Gemmataceae bacterium]